MVNRIAKEHPIVFQNVHNQHFNSSNSEIKMEASAALGMMIEVNIILSSF